GLVFAGLVHSMAELVHQAEATAEALEITNRELERQIEERRQAETQLRTSELRLADAQRLARMGYWELEPRSGHITLSTELSTILGLSPQPNTLALADMVKLVAASDRARLRDALRNAAESLTPFDLEIEIIRPAAEPIHLYILGNVVGNSAGQAVRLWGTGQDVTERHRTEEQLRAIATRLEASNRELQDFAYIASHDLQEPLRKIIAFSDRLSLKFGSVLDETGHDYLQRVQHAARRMQVLIEDLLTLSRVTTRGQPFVEVDLNEVVNDVALDLETRLEESDGHLEIGPLPVIEADPLQMRQLFQNLIGNALKFHRAGVAPRVRIYTLSNGDSANGDSAAEAGEPDGGVDASDRAAIEHGSLEPASLEQAADHYTDRYTIVVEDNGIGFDNKYADRIFQPFQRLHGRSSEYSGTGMGLAICRKIVERHHGVIMATSQAEQGAKFLVTLPKTQPI
ncbi:MAG TPA: ATP-binding protein, partial [Caldilineaceae bacterium]|nr:ATP-binding protein [Caldilineaceae bacterium]